MNLKFLRFTVSVWLGLTLLTVSSMPADAGEGQSYKVIKAVPVEAQKDLRASSNKMVTGISEEQVIKIIQEAFPGLDWDSKPEVTLTPPALTKCAEVLAFITGASTAVREIVAFTQVLMPALEKYSISTEVISRKPGRRNNLQGKGQRNCRKFYKQNAAGQDQLP